VLKRGYIFNMSSTPYAAVTCVDAVTSLGNADAIIVPLDYRFAGENTYMATFAGTFTSVGAGDNIKLQVSPDWKSETAAGAMWVTTDTFASTAFSGAVNGPWAAIRFTKAGDQSAKLVALVAGRNRSKPAIVG
jgi:hypothetical protein